MDPIIGVDLGTTNSVVAVADEQGGIQVLADEKGFKVQPSVVAFLPGGMTVVGAEARQRRIIDPQNTIYSAKRLIGRTFDAPEVAAAATRLPFTIKLGQNQQPVIMTRAGEISITEISAMVLDHMRLLATRSLLGKGASEVSIDRAVVTVPASFTDSQRAATANAGAIAGLEIPQVLNEPTAAALAYGHKRPLDQTIAVYDFGGGTFDVTILELDRSLYQVLGTAGNSFLGGDDIDERVVDVVVERFLAAERVDLRGDARAMQRLRQVAEEIKVDLSRRSQASVSLDDIAYGPGGQPIPLRLEMTRDELVTHASEIIDRTFPVCEEAMRLAGLRATDIDDIVLVGGTTKMPYVRQRVAQYFGKQPRTDINPDEAIAMGAALQGLALRRLLGPKKTDGGQRRLASRPGTARPAVAVTTGLDTPALSTGTNTQIQPRPFGAGALPVTRPGMGAAGPGASVGDSDTTEIELPEVTSTQRLGAPLTPLTGSDDDADELTATRARPGGSPEPIRRLGTNTTLLELAGSSHVTLEESEGSGVFDTKDFGALPTPGRSGRKERRSVPTTDAPTRDIDLAATRKRMPAQRQDSVSGEIGLSAVMSQSASPAAIGDSTGARALDPDAFGTHYPVSDPDPSIELDLRALEAAAEADTLVAAPLGALPLPPAAGAWRSLDGGQAAAPHQVPVVLDVIPHSLGIGTVAGYCEELIHRNSRLPTAIKRVFSTSKHDQRTVRIQVCQGESRRIDENVILGDLVLDGIEPRPRGQTLIEVTFQVDASGILHVRARDSQTGLERDAYLNVAGGQSVEELAAASDRFHMLRG